MFKVKHLKKTFKTKNTTIKVLDDISFTLPSKGMVFVVGKSGTGKSTLLNLLGGLSKPDEGEIYFNNILLNSLNENELSYYRNNHIGFMFQDFNLFDDLTVFENIKLALDIEGKVDDEKVINLIKALEMEKFIHQKANRLSVGQKERVALARAIIKNPKVILCDEPTGNLDTLTAKLILNYLKVEAENKLVVVITHNLVEAYKYADRIIKLEQGKIVEDVIYPYTKRELVIKDDILYINDIKDLNNKSEEVQKILTNQNIDKIEDISKLYVKNDQIDDDADNSSLSKEKMKGKSIFSFHRKLFKKEFFKNIAYLFVAVITLCVFSMFFTFNNYDTSEYLINSLNCSDKDSHLLYQFKASDNGGMHFLEITPFTNEFKKESESYNGHLMNDSILINGEESLLRQGKHFQYESNFKDIFTKETLGTVYGFNEEMLKRYLKLDEVEITSLAPYEKYGVYITDYVFDSMIFYNGISKSIGGPYFTKDVQTNYINGVIKTNYKEEISRILGKNLEEIHSFSEINENTFYNFISYANRFLNVSFSFESNYDEEYKSNFISKYLNDVMLSSDENGTKYQNKYDLYIDESITANENIMSIPIATLNKISGRNDTYENRNQTLKNKIIQIQFRPNIQDESFLEKVTIIPNTGDRILTNSTLYQKILDKQIVDYGIVLEDAETSIRFLKKYRSSGLYLFDYPFTKDYSVAQAIDTYKPLFNLLGYIVLGVSVFLFLILGYETVKHLVFQIGVLKGIGINIHDLYKIYLVNFSHLFIIGTIFYFSISSIFMYILNPLFCDSFSIDLSTSYLRTIVVFTFSQLVILVSLGIIVLALALGVLIPILKVKSIKPADILKRL